MTTDSKNLAWEIFSEALDLEPSEREGFVNRRCGDNEALRREVDSLLTYSGDTRDFLHTDQAASPV